MKKIYKRTFYYKYSLMQKLILTIPVFSLIVLFVIPVTDTEAKIANVILFLFSSISLLMILKKRNYIKWDLNSIEIKVKGNKKVIFFKDQVDKIDFNEKELSINLFNKEEIKIDLEGLSRNEVYIFINTFKKVLNETDDTEILFHNFNKMSLIYKDNMI